MSSKRRHRTLDERVFVAFPLLVRALLGLWARLPTHSRLRRSVLVRLAHQGASAANRRDFDVLLLGFHPQLDYRVVSADTTGAIVPDLVGHHYGHAGYRHIWETMLESFPDLTLEPEEVLDLGDRIVSVTRMTGHGASSGLLIDQFLFQLFFLRRGLVVKQEDFGERGEALAAAAPAGQPEASAAARFLKLS